MPHGHDRVWIAVVLLCSCMEGPEYGTARRSLCRADTGRDQPFDGPCGCADEAGAEPPDSPALPDSAERVDELVAPDIEPVPADPQATPATRALYRNLVRIAESGSFIFGQEFPTTIRYWGGKDEDIDQSDCRDTVGDHPGLHESDFMYYSDDPHFAEVDKMALRAAQGRGAVVMFDWHLRSRSGGSFQTTDQNRSLVHNIVQDLRGDGDWYRGQLDVVIRHLRDLDFPVIFRPFHEMNGSWFWWHAQGNTAEYVALWRLTVDYLRAHGPHSVLLCYAPNLGPGGYFDFYPGDDYVDVLGLDAYEPGSSRTAFVNALVRISDEAAARGKVAALTETGDRRGYPWSNPNFWTRDVLSPIRSDERIRLGWVMTWLNGWGAFYIPYTGLSSGAALADFRTFYEDSHTLFERDLPDMYR